MNKYLFLLLSLAVFGSCSKENNEPNTPSINAENANANDANASKIYARLEFPHLKGGANNRVLVYQTSGEGINYSVEWDSNKKSQRWSCYQMYRANLSRNTSRYYTTDRNKQYPYDPNLDRTLTITPDPYWGSGYDHGHICPSADRLNSRDANYQTFYMTNMQPQRNAFNEGVWLAMENKVRQWATQNNYTFADTLYVCKGGTIDNAAQYTKTGKGLLVPRYFFMAVLRVKNGNYNAIGFWVEHTNNSDTDLAKYAVTIKELEGKTGIDFFCNLPDKRERVIETAPINHTMWNIN